MDAKHRAAAITIPMAFIVTCGCTAKEQAVAPEYELVEVAPTGWKMSPDDAVLAATEYCERVGIDLTVHSTPKIVCDTLDGDRLWCIAYDGFSRVPGDHFMLLINDETGAVEYAAGE